MLNQAHFYHRITRKMVIAFGNLFNNMQMIRYTVDGLTEIERVTVPLSYASKEKFFLRLREDPDVNKGIQITLPRMSFELTGISYDPLRKSQGNIPMAYRDRGGVADYVDNAVPYNFNFNLYIYVRNVEDGTQLMEQILPFFNQDLTLSLKLIDGKASMDIPFVLDTTSTEIESDPTPENERVVTHTLSFVGKGYFYGPVKSKKLIRTANTNINHDTPFSTPKYIRLANTFGQFKIGEVVYQGENLSLANARAFISAYTDSDTVKLEVIHGRFVTNTIMRGAVTNATANVSAYIPNASNTVVEVISITPDPNTANSNSNYLYAEFIDEWKTP